jgi:hypothetical protein
VQDVRFPARHGLPLPAATLSSSVREDQDRFQARDRMSGRGGPGQQLHDQADADAARAAPSTGSMPRTGADAPAVIDRNRSGGQDREDVGCF